MPVRTRHVTAPLGALPKIDGHLNAVRRPRPIRDRAKRLDSEVGSAALQRQIVEPNPPHASAQKYEVLDLLNRLFRIEHLGRVLPIVSRLRPVRRDAPCVAAALVPNIEIDAVVMGRNPLRPAPASEQHGRPIRFRIDDLLHHPRGTLPVFSLAADSPRARPRHSRIDYIRTTRVPASERVSRILFEPAIHQCLTKQHTSHSKD